MKTKLLFFIAICICAVGCGSSDSHSNQEGVLNFGEAEYYRGWDLFGIQPKNPMMQKTIYFDYENMEEGKPIVFEVIDENGKPLHGVDLYIIDENGAFTKCEKGRFKITPPQPSIEIGLQFQDEISEGWYGWTLRVVDAGELDRIEFPEGNESIAHDSHPSVLRFKAGMEKKLNRPRVAVDSTLSTILICLLVWIFVLKFMLFDRFKIKQIIIEDSESERRILVRGALSLTLSSKTQKQSIWERIFVGKRLFYRDEFFSDGDVVISPRNRKTITIKAPDNYDVDSNIISKEDDAPSSIKNSNRQKKEVRIV